jgi:hypothetical protein
LRYLGQSASDNGPRTPYAVKSTPDDGFLQQPCENTLADLTDVAIDDRLIAITPGLYRFNHRAVLAGINRDKFSGTLRNFRRITVLAQQQSGLEGSGPRCQEMLARHEKPPLMLYLIWREYTRLAKEIETGAIYRSSGK